MACHLRSKPHPRVPDTLQLRLKLIDLRAVERATVRNAHLARAPLLAMIEHVHPELAALCARFTAGCVDEQVASDAVSHPMKPNLL